MADKNFPFIVSAGPKVPKDPALRTLIRKQAMRDAGLARKKRVSGGRASSKQRLDVNEVRNNEIGDQSSISRHSSTNVGPEGTLSPLSAPSGSASARASACASTSPSTSTSASAFTQESEIASASPVQAEMTLTVPSHGRTNSDKTRPHGLAMQIPLVSEYEAMRIKFNFDIRDLSILTSFNVGKNTMLAISSRQELLSTLVGSSMQSYLHFVPGRYGHSPYLTPVIECLAARAHSRVSSQESATSPAVMRTYAKALVGLQDALAKDASLEDPNLLCAIQMLSLYEMLDPLRTEAYVHHVNGSALLVQRRSPSGFRSDFEKMLFHARIGPAFTEALYQNRKCYLEEPQWMGLYQSMIQETPWLTDRSALVIRIRMQMLGLASVLVDTSRVMDSASYDNEASLEVEHRAREAHQKLGEHLDEYQLHVIRMSTCNVPESELVLRREIYGTMLECLCIYKRVLASLCELERLHLESEAQPLATRILELQEQPAPPHSWIYSTHEKGVAATVRLTREAWQEELDHLSLDEKRAVACKRWADFNGYLHGQAPG